MQDQLRLKYDMRVPRCMPVFTLHYLITDNFERKLVLDYNRVTDPVGVAAWRAGCICQRIFYAAGVNHI